MPRSAIVLICDRLNPSFLGPYGNTWIETDALNQLAAQSLLVEQCLTHSPELAVVYDSYWSGTNLGPDPDSPSGSLLQQFADVQVSTTLLTDATELTSYRWADDFAHHVCIPDSEHARLAAGVEDTEWATILSAAISELPTKATAEKQSQFLWVHARGCEGPWDAPYALRSTFADEDDPDPPAFVTPPSRELSGEVDPDELLGLQQAYSAEVRAFDDCLGPLVDRLSTPELANTLFVFTSPRGFPLGNHGVVGDARPSLHVESLHTPLLIRFPDGRFQAERSQVLWQPTDVQTLLRRWMLGEDVQIDDLGGERAASCDGEYWSLRTPAWFATGQRKSEEGGEDVVRLYAKPDDRFEANDVADICEEIAKDMRGEYEQMVSRAQAGPAVETPPLPEHLRKPQV